jgi:hypothetical protein
MPKNAHFWLARSKPTHRHAHHIETGGGVALVAPIPYVEREAGSGGDTVFFAYHIVPRGGHMRQALESGACTAPDLQVAKLHVQTVPAPSVAGKFGLEVILQNSEGAEVWRGPYLGHA